MPVELDPAVQLRRGLESMEAPRPAELAKRLIRFGELLLAENEKTNLVGAHTLAGLVAPHFLDSLAPVITFDLPAPIVDLGSGAGLPGIPVALAFPNRAVMLVEPRTKRAEFLRLAVKWLSLENVSIVRLSAGAAALIPEHRGKAGSVLVRALGDPTRAMGLALPLMRSGGKLVLYLGKRKAPNKHELTAALTLGAEFVKATAVHVPYLVAERNVWWFRKADPRRKRRRG